MSKAAKRLRRLWVLLQALMWLWLYRLALWLLPFRWVSPRSPRATGQGPAALPHLARSIDRAARFVPQATCLVRALAGARLFAAAGQQASVVIGVRRRSGTLEAHAWLAVGETVVLGNVQDLHDYHPLG